MIDPPRPMLDVFRQGDDGILPTPTGGEYGETPITNYQAALSNQPVMWRPFWRALDPGAELKLDAGDRADFWIVSTRNTANTVLWVYAGESATGEPVEIGPSGRAVIPCIASFSLYLRNVGAAIATVSAAAVRGFREADIRFGP